MAALDDFKKFVTDAQSSGSYANWARDNHGDANYSITNPGPGSDLALWYAFRDALLAGQRPAAPSMHTAFGRELIDGGILYLDATPPVTPPPPPLKITISGTAQVGKTLTAVIS